MVELSLIASSAALPPAIVHPDQCTRKLRKEFQTLLSLNGANEYAVNSGSLRLDTQHFDAFSRQAIMLSGHKGTSISSPVAEKPVLIDVQDSCPDSVHFSFGIAEKCIQREKILKFLMSGSNLAEKAGLDISLLSDLMGYHTMARGMSPQSQIHMDNKFCLCDMEMVDSQHSLYRQKQFYVPEPLVDFVENLSHTPLTSVHPDGGLLFAGSGSEMRDLLSVFSDFSIPKRSKNICRQAMLVPYFTRKGPKRAQIKNQLPPLDLQTQMASSLKSADSIKLKQLHKKKKNKKDGKEKDFIHRNNFHASESLLSVILDKNMGSTEILSLKKSAHEVSELLTQFSAGIAGAGLAVIFTVLSRLVCGRVSYFSTRLLNTGLGFGLFWLSSAINGLRDTIISITKNSGHQKVNEKDISGKLQRNMKDILFRVVALAAVAMLRFR